jgi:hypothetical protein
MTLDPSVRQIRGACPLDCPDTCSWIVTVKGGKAVALRGDPGTTINATVDERDSYIGGGAVYHDNRVRVEKYCPIDSDSTHDA